MKTDRKSETGETVTSFFVFLQIKEENEMSVRGRIIAELSHKQESLFNELRIFIPKKKGKN